MGERYEIIVDFANHKGKNVMLKNARGVIGNPDFAATDLVMRFIVGDTLTDDCNNGDVPSTLRDAVPPIEANVSRNFHFERIGEHWVVNGVGGPILSIGY